ncbi:hypothetical protein ACFZCK_14225 [Kitasatospora purpeofusca]|uniref:hypothetical protein n=1 Tax=Kitasatospora purpeofusca TaxID=67352 RepID=UPI0036EB308E
MSELTTPSLAGELAALKRRLSNLERTPQRSARQQQLVVSNVPQAAGQMPNPTTQGFINMWGVSSRGLVAEFDITKLGAGWMAGFQVYDPVTGRSTSHFTNEALGAKRLRLSWIHGRPVGWQTNLNNSATPIEIRMWGNTTGDAANQRMSLRWAVALAPEEWSDATDAGAFQYI